MDTFMNADNKNKATAYGEYPVSKSIKAASSSVEAIPTSTEGFAQYDTTTNEIGLDTQANTNIDFQALTNIGGDDNDFARVNILSSDESSNLQAGGFQETTTTNTNVDFTASAQVDTNMNFDTNTQFDFGTTNTTSELDVLQATSSNTGTQYGEYQASSPITDTAESAQIVENTSIEGNMNFNADTFQSVEPNVEMENNNFDFTTSNSIIGATSALNNFDSTGANFDINKIDFTASTPAVDTNTNFEINTTTTETTYGQTNLAHELVDPNPIETNVNFSTQGPNINELPASEPTYDTTANTDINTFAQTSAEPVVDTTPSFDANAFPSTEQTFDTTQAFDANTFTSTEQTVDTTPAFDATAFTATQQNVDTTQAFDATAFTATQQNVDTTQAFDATAFTATQQNVDTTPAFDATA